MKVFKGHDRAMVNMVDHDGVIDGINNFLDTRNVTASRIFLENL